MFLYKKLNDLVIKNRDKKEYLNKNRRREDA